MGSIATPFRCRGRGLNKEQSVELWRQIAPDRRIASAVMAPSPCPAKSPARQDPDDQARELVQEFVAG